MVRGGGSGVTQMAHDEAERSPNEAWHDSSSDDPFGLDLAFREQVVPTFRFFYERYWRVDAMGLHNVPTKGPALYVANHSGAIPFDGAMICTSLYLHDRRALRFLYDRFVANVAPLDAAYRRLGGMVASRENALELLKHGEHVLIFPEGVSGVAKPFSDRYRLRSFSPGFARLALALDVPVVPVAVVGAEEIHPMVTKVTWLAKSFGIPYLPVTPTFPFLGPVGLVPLPTKWFIAFGEPLYFNAEYGAEGANDRILVNKLAEQVRNKIQSMIDLLIKERRSILFG